LTAEQEIFNIEAQAMVNQKLIRKNQIIIDTEPETEGKKNIKESEQLFLMRNTSNKKFPGWIIIFFIIIVLTLIVLGGVWYYLQNNLTIPNKQSAVNLSPVTSEPVSVTLNLASPDDNVLIFDDSLLIQGKTSPQATVILSFDKDDSVIEAGNSGDFSATIKLQPGVNQFTVSVFDNFGNSKSENRTVYYSKEKL
jgi:hypothetical protein